MTRESAAPQAVLVHGMWSSFDTWAATPRVLQRAGVDVQRYDLPQHGLRFDDPRALGRLGVRDYVGKNGFPGALLGLSGGIDSALVLAIEIAQGVLGWVQYLLDLPVGLVALHMLGAAVTSAALTWVVVRAFRPITIVAEPEVRVARV